MDFRRGYALFKQNLELGDGSHFERHHFLAHYAQQIGMGVRLDGVVQCHASHGGAETMYFPAHELGVEQQERSPVMVVPHRVVYDDEVERDLRFAIVVVGQSARPCCAPLLEAGQRCASCRRGRLPAATIL